MINHWQLQQLDFCMLSIFLLFVIILRVGGHFRRRQNRAILYSSNVQCNGVGFSVNIYKCESIYLEIGNSEVFMIGSGMWELFSDAKLGGKYAWFNFFFLFFFSGSPFFMECVGLCKPVHYNRKWKLSWTFYWTKKPTCLALPSNFIW